MTRLAHDYILEDGHVLRVTIELGLWSLWLDEDVRAQVTGSPLEGVLMEVFGLNPAHDEMPEALGRLACRIRSDFPRGL